MSDFWYHRFLGWFRPPRGHRSESGEAEARTLIRTARAAETLGGLLNPPDDRTTGTLAIYESAAKALVKLGCSAARRALKRARSGPAAAYVDAAVRLAREGEL